MLTLPALCSTMFCDYYSLFSNFQQSLFILYSKLWTVSSHLSETFWSDSNAWSWNRHPGLVPVSAVVHQVLVWRFRPLHSSRQVQSRQSLLARPDLGHFHQQVRSENYQLPLFDSFSSGFTFGDPSPHFSSTNQVSTGWSTFISSTITGKMGGLRSPGTF